VAHNGVTANARFGKSKIYFAAQNKLWIEPRMDMFYQPCVNVALTKFKKSSATMTNAIITDGRSSR
jgi:hypothetical protein